MRGACSIIGVIYYIIFLAEFPRVVELCRNTGCVPCDGNYQIAIFPSGSAADVDMHEKSSRPEAQNCLFLKITVLNI